MKDQFYYVRWMTEPDMEQVYEIELACFKDNRWTKHDFSAALRKGIGLVAIGFGGELVGFTIYNMEPQRYELLTLAAKYPRLGIGTALVTHLRNKLSRYRRIKIEAMVRETNLSAQLFFKSVGFKAVKVKKDTYFDTDEDGYLMQCLLEGCQDVEKEEVYEEENHFS
jgi:ribosomal-protein-alanine N-acetyltransferase